MCLTILEHCALKGSSEKKDKNLKENYRPANLLPYIAKAFVWFIFKHISNFVSLSSRNISVLFKKVTTQNIFFYSCLKNGTQQSIEEHVLVHF